MAIKLSGSVSRKVPIEGVQFSSQSYGSSLEIEINSDDPAVIQDKLHHVYASLGAAIDAEIAAAHGHNRNGGQRPAPATNRLATAQPVAGNGNQAARGNGNGANGKKLASEAQQKCIFALTKKLGLEMSKVLADHGVTDPAQLTITTASNVINVLKRQEAAAN